jgi:hypothetical protein
MPSVQISKLNQKGVTKKTGFLKVDFIQRLERLGARSSQELIESVERLLTGIPDYDSGFIFMETADVIELEHDLGQVPTRYAMFFSQVEEPEENRHKIFVMSSILEALSGSAFKGVRLSHINRNKCELRGGADSVFENQEDGYVRLMLWR